MRRFFVVNFDEFTVSIDNNICIIHNVNGHFESFSKKQETAADVDGSGSVDSADSLSILRYVVGYADNGILIKL